MTDRAIAAVDAHLGSERLHVFDVGARRGLDARWQQFHRYLSVVGFEPDPAECARLARGSGALRYPARFLPYAIGRDTRSDVPFHVTRWPVGSSLLPPDPWWTAEFTQMAAVLQDEGQRRVETVSLDEACDRERVWPDFLKVDVEGAELDVLRGGERALARALALDVEVEFVPLRLGQPLFADVDAHLRGRGWRLLGLKRVHWRRSAGLDPLVVGHGGQLVQADALYVNARLLDGGLPAASAMKLLLILAAYRQADYILHLIRTPGLVAAHLTDAQRSELRARLTSRPTLGHMLCRWLLPESADRRRALVDGLQRGDAAVWCDADFF